LKWIYRCCQSNYYCLPPYNYHLLVNYSTIIVERRKNSVSLENNKKCKQQTQGIGRPSGNGKLSVIFGRSNICFLAIFWSLNTRTMNSQTKSNVIMNHLHPRRLKLTQNRRNESINLMLLLFLVWVIKQFTLWAWGSHVQCGLPHRNCNMPCFQQVWYSH